MLRRGNIIPVPSEYAKALSHFKITQPYNTQKSRFHCGNGIFEYCSINKIKFEVVHGDGIAILDAELAHFVYDAVFTHHALKIREGFAVVEVYRTHKPPEPFALDYKNIFFLF